MDTTGFRQFLSDRKLSEDVIAQHIAFVARFEDFLSGAEAPAAERVSAFLALMMQEALNTPDSFYALARYGWFTRNYDLYVTVLELVDGSEVLENLYTRLGQAAGAQTRDAVFQGVERPALGASNLQKARTMRVVMERLERAVAPDTCEQLLSSSLRDLSDAPDPEERAKYQECGTLDAYLERRGRDFIAHLEQIKQEGRPFFTQPITDEVIDFVRQHPEIAQGVREGNVIYEVKIPYMAQAYLAETDERLKRYHYCHCPWARESLKEGEVTVSPTFCLCSAGFHKKPWEDIFGRPLKAEVVESVLKGDPWCKIAIHLPEDVV